MAVLVREAKPLPIDSTFRLSDSQGSPKLLRGVDIQEKRRRGRIYLILTSLHYAPLFLHSLVPSLLLLIYRRTFLFNSSTPSSLKNIPLALVTFARLLAWRLGLCRPIHPLPVSRSV